MPKRLLTAALVISGLSLAVIPRWTSRGKAQAARVPTRPKLVILISIDQFRNDYLDRFRPHFVDGGFNRLMAGARFTNCRYDYAITATGPGHASIATGTYPSIHGIIENEWYDRTLKRPVNCVEDLNTRIVDSGRESGELRSASPRLLWGSTFGDELRLATNFQAKVVSVSLKDRGAVLPGGHTANAAYWYHPRAGRFVSSTYYLNALPDWVARFNDQVPTKAYCGKSWKALPETPGADGRVFEEYSPDPSEPCPGPKFLRQFASSPFQTEIELRFVREGIRQEKLGQDAFTDLLTISLSANDFVGHRYGPYSPQVADMVLRTDRELAAFFQDVDRIVGLNNVWIALSGDHGVAPTPQVIKERRLGLGTFQPGQIRETVQKALNQVFGNDQWVEYLDMPYIYLNQEALRKRRVNPADAETEAARAAMAVPGVFTAFPRKDLLVGNLGGSPLARKALNSFNPRRSGDVFIVVEPYVMSSVGETEATHGTPWSYDSQVPLLIWGRGFRPGTYVDPCQPVDLVPTLAAALGLNQPSGATGTPLAATLPRD